MIAKILGWLLATVLLAVVTLVDAQEPGKIPRIGYVSGGNANNPGLSLAAFRQALRDLGYIEGKNILVEYRYTEGMRDRIPGLVAELLQLKVDVFVSGTPSVIFAAKQATKTIPIVMVTTNDPVAAGLVDSLARPGGNLTGVTRLTRELSGKRLDLLREAVPGTSRVGLLVGSDSTTDVARKEYFAAARGLKIQIQSLEVSGQKPDLTGAFQAAVKGRVNALITARTTALNPYPKEIAELAMKYRLPCMFEVNEGAEAGGLISYAANDTDSFRRAAVYVDKILKGTKPADLPVEQPMKFELVINLKTAKQIGVTIPPDVLARANRIIR